MQMLLLSRIDNMYATIKTGFTPFVTPNGLLDQTL